MKSFFFFVVFFFFFFFFFMMEIFCRISVQTTTGNMASKIREILAQQARLPKKGLWGWVTYNALKYQNGVLEKNAARLCAIEPDHKVLEIGFGPGVGVKHALQYVKGGAGKICGVDQSTYMVEKTSARFHKPMQKGKVELGLGDVMSLPYGTDTFHRVFHCCSYYLWPSMQDALEEIHRVMKPGGMMVTVLNLQQLQKDQAKGLLKYGHFDPLKYMCALELTGFQDVRIEYLRDRSVNYQAIFAHLPTTLLNEEDLRDLEEKVTGDSVNDTASDLHHKKSVHNLQPDSSALHK